MSKSNSKSEVHPEDQSLISRIAWIEEQLVPVRARLAAFQARAENLEKAWLETFAELEQEEGERHARDLAAERAKPPHLQNFVLNVIARQTFGLPHHARETLWSGLRRYQRPIEDLEKQLKAATDQLAKQQADRAAEIEAQAEAEKQAKAERLRKARELKAALAELEAESA